MVMARTDGAKCAHCDGVLGDAVFVGPKGTCCSSECAAGTRELTYPYDLRRREDAFDAGVAAVERKSRGEFITGRHRVVRKPGATLGVDNGRAVFFFDDRLQYEVRIREGVHEWRDVPVVTAEDLEAAPAEETKVSPPGQLGPHAEALLRSARDHENRTIDALSKEIDDTKRRLGELIESLARAVARRDEFATMLVEQGKKSLDDFLRSGVSVSFQTFPPLE